jgi:tripartite-type tricarboxylate transporter receptor subunit TctC
MKNTNTLFIAALLLSLGAISGVQAQTDSASWPSKSIRWVIPFPPGGAIDVIARAVGEHAGKTLGQTFVIDNRPGAGGNIGADLVAKATPDGYTIMSASLGMAANKSLYGKLSYDPIKDFSPVGVLAIVPNVLVTNATQPDVKSVKDAIAAAKRAPDKLTYASAGNGTSLHLSGAMFTSMAQIQMLHVPYKGSGPAVTDLLGGQVNYMFDSITSARPHIESGRLRALGVTSAKRSSTLKDVPTIAEAALPGYEVSPWFAVFAPAGTPPLVIKKLNAAFLEALKQPEIQAKFASIGAETVGSSPQELEKLLQDETVRWTRLIKDLNIGVN